MRKINSLRLFEKVIYNESLVAQKEKLFLTNGRLFMETGTNENYDGVDVDFKILYTLIILILKMHI